MISTLIKITKSTGTFAISLVIGIGSFYFLNAIFSTSVADEKKYGGIAIDAEDVTLGKKEYSPHLDRGYTLRV